MNYKKLIDKLENDTSVSELELYLSGKRRIDRRTATPEQKVELLNKVIPRLIKEMHKDIEVEIKSWYNAPIFRLAYIHCLNNKIPISKMIEELFKMSPKQYRKIFNELTPQQQSLVGIFDVSSEIMNRINKDSDNIAITQRFKEYYKRTVNTELI